MDSGDLLLDQPGGSTRRINQADQPGGSTGRVNRAGQPGGSTRRIPAITVATLAPESLASIMLAKEAMTGGASVSNSRKRFGYSVSDSAIRMVREFGMWRLLVVWYTSQQWSGVTAAADRGGRWEAEPGARMEKRRAVAILTIETGGVGALGTYRCREASVAMFFAGHPIKHQKTARIGTTLCAKPKTRARGDADEDSDLDVMAVEEVVADRAGEMVRLNRLLRSFDVPVDLLAVSAEKFNYWRDTPGNVYFEAATAGFIASRRPRRS